MGFGLLVLDLSFVLDLCGCLIYVYFLCVIDLSWLLVGCWWLPVWSGSVVCCWCIACDLSFSLFCLFGGFGYGTVDQLLYFCV